MQSVTGDDSSIKSKRSIITIVNQDYTCMARAVTMAFAKVNSVTTAKWRELTDDDGNTEQLIWRYKKVPDWYYNKLRDHRDLATARQTL